MIVKQIELHNFRNYESLNLPLSDQVNIFYGDNAQGKTNILESVYVCSTTKSHKGTKDRDMIKIGEESGSLDNTLSISNDFYSEELDFKIENTMKLAEPIVTVIIGLVIGVFIIAMVIPMFDAINSIQ